MLNILSKSKAILIGLLCFITVQLGFSQSTTLVNPILTGFYPDPSIVKVGPDYYLVNSTFSYFPGIPVFHSKDLKNWKQIGNVIHRTSQMDFMGERMTRGLFAPAISYHDGTFYVTCTDIDNLSNFVATAKNPAGPWSDPIRVPEVRGIDPSLNFDDDGKAYFLYNSDAPDNKPLYSGHRTVKIYEFDVATMKVVGEPKILINGGVDLSKKPVWIEAPHFWKKDGWYYLYAAEGGTSVNHSEVVLRSKSVWGPFVPYEDNPILTQRHLPENRKDPITSAGHAQFVEGPDGETYAVFLAVRPYEGDHYNTGRETFIAPVEWKDGWPIINPNSEEIKYYYPVDYKEIKQENALPQSGNFQYTLTFEDELDPTLLFMRTIDSSSFSLSKKDGLTLQLKPETVMERGNPSFIGKRQQHLYSTAEIALDFSANSSNEKAGLIIFQNENHFYFLCQSKAEGKNVIQLYKSNTEEQSMELLAEAPLSDNMEKVGLRISSEGDTYTFHYAENLKDWKLLKDKVDAKFLSTRTAGGFIGCLYGMYATSSGEETSNSASFSYLKYSGNAPMFKQNDVSLKEALSGKFYVGTALNTPQITERDTAALEVIKKHFNAIVAENCMKSGPIHPAEDEYNFELADQFVEFGEQNNMLINGHTLVWHSQAPRWFFTDSEGKDVSREVLIQRMKDHIFTVVGRYKGKVDTWDVVNEAILDDGSYRKSKFYEIIGEDFIKLAFEFAHEADPEAELYYNDYSMALPEKRKGVVAMIKKLQEQGVKVDGIGMQGHVGLDYPAIEEFENSILAFAELGVPVMITELDITVLPSRENVGADVAASMEYQQKMNPYAEGLPDSVNTALNERYLDFFKLFLKHQDKISRVTFWGVNDGHSWRNNWPIRGRTDYPLLFDRNNQPKPVLYGIIDLAK